MSKLEKCNILCQKTQVVEVEMEQPMYDIDMCAAGDAFKNISM